MTSTLGPTSAPMDLTGPLLMLDNATYQPALRAIDDIHDDLRREQRSLAETMRVLLHSGWTGPAAAEFADGWSDWQAGCDEVLHGLAWMAEVMRLVGSQLSASDAAQSVSLHRVESRLGGRP